MKNNSFKRPGSENASESGQVSGDCLEATGQRIGASRRSFPPPWARREWPNLYKLNRIQVKWYLEFTKITTRD